MDEELVNDIMWGWGVQLQPGEKEDEERRYRRESQEEVGSPFVVMLSASLLCPLELKEKGRGNPTYKGRGASFHGSD